MPPSSMSMRPIVAVTTQTLPPIPGELPECWVMGKNYVNVLTGFGAVPWVVPAFNDAHDEGTLRRIYDGVDAIFLPGGADMDPQSYGAEKALACGRTDPARDYTELQLTRWAKQDNKPVLAVCRGFQVVNVASGGVLYQDLATERDGSLKHDYWPKDGGPTREYLAHDVEVVAGTLTETLFSDRKFSVNSMHHQGIKELAPDLIATAHAPDGLIEAVESASGDWFCVGVQWHPESLVQNDMRSQRLYRAFMDAAAAYATARR
jgi:putative glutamine amidotransferase